MKQVTAEDVYSWMLGWTPSEAAKVIAKNFNELLAEVAQLERTPLPTVEESCENCEYWDITSNTVGDCCRYPPVFNARILPNDESADCYGWKPKTFFSDWCGEWKPCGKDGA